MLKSLSLLFTGLSLSAAWAASNEVFFSLPIDCLGKNCQIVKYLDQEPGPKARDYRCGLLSSERYEGTSFAVRDMEDVKAGVNVLAAASGVVASVRDGLEDVAVTTPAEMEKIADKYCGNVVVIKHGSWDTSYCHLKNGSITVKAGDNVQEGQKIGLIGMSGMVDYPNLRFIVRYRNRLSDPFLGNSGSMWCKEGNVPLWKKEALAQLPYSPVAIVNAGFADKPPQLMDSRLGKYRNFSLSTDAGQMVVWVETRGLSKADFIEFKITDPDGKEILKKSQVLDNSVPEWFGVSGLNKTQGSWPKGTYVGEISIKHPPFADVKTRFEMVVK